MNGAGTWESGSDDLSGPVQMRRSRAQPSDTDSTDGVKLTDEDWQNVCLFFVFCCFSL